MKIKYDFRSEGDIEVGYVKGCPFCGKTDKLGITPKDNFEELHKENGDACVVLSCNRCNAQMSEHNYHGSDYGMKVGILVTMWNNRRETNDGD